MYGGGSCTSAGFSASVGTVSTGVIAGAAWSSSSRGTLRGKKEDEDCVEGFCCLFGCLFCCSKKPVDRRLLVATVVFWLIVAVLTSGLVLKYAAYDDTQFQLAVGDQRIVDESVSPFLCHSEKLSTLYATPFTLWSLEEAPKIDKNKSRKQTFLGTASIPWNQYRYYAFYYLEGTEVDLQLCAPSQGTFLLIRGRGNMAAYKGDTDCSSCFETKTVFQPSANASCSWGLRYRYTATKSDYYYHAVTLPVSTSYDSIVTFTFTMNRTEYNLPSPGTLTTRTVVHFASWTRGVIVVAYNSSTSTSVTFNATCNTRVASYLIVFLLLPICLFVALFFLIVGVRSKTSTPAPLTTA